jgi:hypothetical protein
LEGEEGKARSGNFGLRKRALRTIRSSRAYLLLSWLLTVCKDRRPFLFCSWSWFVATGVESISAYVSDAGGGRLIVLRSAFVWEGAGFTGKHKDVTGKP